jgi:L-arabinokinase
VAFYVSGHGFGHATRSTVSIGAIAQIGIRVTVVTSAPLFLFDDAKKDFPELLEVREAYLDVGVVQADAISVDSRDTMARLKEFMADASEKIEQEANWLRSKGVKLVLADASFVPCAAAKRAGVPSAFVSNFTWDSILEVYKDKEGKDDALVKRVFELCREANYLLRMPGWIDVPAFPDPDNNPRIFDTTLVVRRHRRSREEVRRSLGLSVDDKVLLISFGGHFLAEPGWADRNFLPPGWVGLICGPGARQMHSNSGTRLANVPMSEAYVPDLANASDVVLGKLGFGTCSEVIDAGVPFVYISRIGFIEEEGLLRLMQDANPEGSVTEMSHEDFRAGNWAPHLLKVVDKKGNKPLVNMSRDGDKWIANWVAEFLERGGPPEKMAS